MALAAEELTMLMICKGCLAAFSVGAQACPQCQGTDHVEQGSPAHTELAAAAARPAPPVEPPASGPKAAK